MPRPSRWLRSAQREMLLAHIDGFLAIAVRRDQATRDSLVRRGFLRRATALESLRLTEGKRPRYTCLTDRGRQAVAQILSEAADTLIAAGFPIEEIMRGGPQSESRACVMALVIAQREGAKLDLNRARARTEP